MGLEELSQGKLWERGDRCSPLGNLESWILTLSSVRKMSSAGSWLRSLKKIWREAGRREVEGGRPQQRQLPPNPRSPGCGVLIQVPSNLPCADFLALIFPYLLIYFSTHLNSHRNPVVKITIPILNGCPTSYIARAFQKGERLVPIETAPPFFLSFF